MTFKDYIANKLLNKTLRFKTRGDCMIPLDVTGKIIGYNIINNEIVFKVEVSGGKIIRIGENHPKLDIIEKAP